MWREEKPFSSEIRIFYHKNLKMQYKKMWKKWRKF
jgi:hypothetical protein